ncbi:uncharacterized protein [Amphiura filiformis]|uniref:uncharacterized protein n=1 Tax=Amphiura filiformis TaxID=82378 RepID=UPI003B20CEFD
MASLSDIEEELLVPDTSSRRMGSHMAEERDAREQHVPESTTSSNISSSYFSAVLLMFALSCTAVALAVVPIMITTDEAFLESLRTGEVIVNATFGIVIITICSWYVYMRFKSTDIFISQEHSPTCSFSRRCLDGTIAATNLPTKYTRITVFVFGIGTILGCILNIVQNSLEDSKRLSRILDSIVHLIYIFILFSQLLFFHFYEGKVLCNRSIFHYTIAIMVGAEVWVWVSGTLWPLWLFDWTGNNTDSGHTNITHLPSVLEFSKAFLEPCYVSFATIAISILFNLWHTVGDNKSASNSRQCHRDRRLEYTPNELCESQSPTTPDSDTASDNNDTSPYRKLMVISVRISPFLGLVYLVICVLTGLNQIVFQYYVEIVLYRSIKLVYFTILGILSAILLFKLRQVPIGRRHYPLNSSEYVLLFGTCSDSMYYFLRIVASIGYLTLDSTTDIDSSIAWLYLIYSFVALIQSWIQTKLFIIVRRKHVPSYVKYVLVFISVINFAEWFTRGFNLGFSKNGASQTVTTPIMEQVFGDTSTRVMRLLLLPVMSLYRFHSGMVAVELIHQHQRV